MTARLVSRWLSDRLGQSFFVENRPGAGTNIGTEVVTRAPADGHTLLLVSLANAVNATLYDSLNFNFIRDIAPVVGLVRGPLVMGVNPAVPATTVPELIAYARASPDEINIASAGNGTPGHRAAELFPLLTDLYLLDVPSHGGTPALSDPLSGPAQVMFDNLPTSLEYIRAGKVRPLAVTTAARADALPDVPSLSESVPGFEVSSWFGIGVPTGTPKHIIDKLNTQINAALVDPALKARLDGLGTALGGSPADFGKLVADETDKWARVIKDSSMKTK